MLVAGPLMSGLSMPVVKKVSSCDESVFCLLAFSSPGSPASKNERGSSRRSTDSLVLRLAGVLKSSPVCRQHLRSECRVGRAH